MTRYARSRHPYERMPELSVRHSNLFYGGYLSATVAAA